MKCPQCGSEHIATNAALDIHADEYKLYTCQNCYHRFNSPDDETAPGPDNLERNA